MQDLKNALNVTKLILISFLFSQSVFSQIPINGFCKYNCYKADSGFTNFMLINFNSDFYSDFILYSPSKKEVEVIKGEKKGVLEEKKSFRIPVEISSVLPVQNRRGPDYFFVNRKKLKAGIYELKTSGKPNLKNSISFDSYPDYLSVANVDGKGKNEVLVSGSSFNGLSIIYQDDKELTEKKLVKGTSFSHSVFCDLNNDHFPDIAAYNVLKRRFEFFYNDSKGEFRRVRSISFPEKITSLKSFDINLDYYADLIFTSGKSFYIWYGDFRSSYENTTKIETLYKPDKYILGDFNKDGRIDIAYLNLEHSLVSVLFAKNDFEFYPEVIYLQQKELTDISPYYSRFVDGIAVLSLDGNIHTITKLTSFAESVDISLGARPGALSFFDDENNGITDFCFIDEYDKKIKFILRNSGGVPARFFSCQLYGNHNKIISESLNTGFKNYVCYSSGKKLIEIIKADFDNNKIKRTALYSPGPIKDLKLKKVNDNEYNIYFTYTNNNSLSLGMFSYKDFKFSFSDEVIDTGKIYDAGLGLEDEPVVYYWQKSEQNALLKEKYLFNSSEADSEITAIPQVDSLMIYSYVGDLLNMNQNVLISFLISPENDYELVAYDNFLSIIKGDENLPDFRINSSNDLFFGETRFNGLKRLCVFLPEKNEVDKVEFINKGKDLAITQIATQSSIRNFFIKNMTSKNYHIIYSDADKNCVTIKRIKE